MSGKKPVEEARSRLTEKLVDVKQKAQSLHDLISSITDEAIFHAESTLKHKSKTKFLNKYPQVSQELEICLNRLLILSDAVSSVNDDDGSDNEGSSSEEGYDFATDLTETQNLASVVTASTMKDGQDSQTCLSSNTTTITPTIGSLVTEASHVTGKNHDSIVSIEPIVSAKLQKYDSQERLISSELIVEPFKWDSDTAYPVIITNIITPWEFYIQLVNPENDIMEQLCMAFMKEATNGYKGGIDYIPPIGVFCCAKSHIDEAWYRAKIVNVFNNPALDIASVKTDLSEVSVKVFFIDEGYSTVVNLSSLRPLEKKYAAMPCQAVQCILGGIQPVEALHQSNTLNFVACNKMWSSESISWMTDLVESNSIFGAFFYYPPNASYQPPHNINRDTLICDLYMYGTETKIIWFKLTFTRLPIENHLAFQMIVKKLAVHCAYFCSELNRKKSQRALLEALGDAIKKEDTIPGKRNEVNITEKPPHQTDSSANRTNGDATNRMVVAAIRMDGDTSQVDQNKNVKLSDIRHKKKDKVVSSEFLSSAQNNQSSSSSPTNNIESKVPLKEKPSFSSQCVRNTKKVPKIVDAVKKYKNETENKILVENSISDNNNKTVLSDQSFELGGYFTETLFVTEEQGFAKVLVSEVVDPGLFYVHLITPEVAMLDQMMVAMNEFYAKEGDNICRYTKDITYEVGMIVVARYVADNQWYRAIISSKALDTSNNNKDHAKKSYQYTVFHMDFGTSECISQDSILPILREFCELPQETIPCCLADIEPLSRSVSKQLNTSTIAAGDESTEGEDEMMMLESENDVDKNNVSKWSNAAISRLKQLVLHQLPLMSALKITDKNSDGLYEVYLYDTTYDKDIFINQYLVDEGLVLSKVFCKTVATVQISESDLDGDVDPMSEWNPMKEQYVSKRNTYSIDIDDPGVAMLGYVEQQKQICHNFSRRGHCYRGSDCRYLHVHPGDPSLNNVEVFCMNDVIEPPGIGEWAAVTVTALFDASHFWVIFPYGLDLFSEITDKRRNCGNEEITLDYLSKRMNEYYIRQTRDDKTDLTILAEGELVAARFHEDSMWYRARVINTADELVQVFYVDYGNTDVVTDDNIRKLLPDFLHLPFQAVECFLNETDVKTDIQDETVIYEDIRRKFTELTADKVLMAHIIFRSFNKHIVVELYDTSTEPHTHINKLVRQWEGVTHVKPNRAASKPNKSNRIVNKNVINYIPG